MIRAPSLAAVVLLAACAGPTAASAELAPPDLAPFLGSFRGTLRMFGDAVVREVPMELHVAPGSGSPGRWTFRLVYGDGAQGQVRDYELVLDDERRGRYRIDEKNGIVLAARLVAGELVSVFAADGPTLCVRYRAVPEGIEFALESFDPATAADTGMGVRTFAEFALQRALLRRVAAAR
ncbi:MAG: hypothetical protein JNK15_16930 [Planctomycetes bacterium]|nr:hypothetical protein [Planctomycetota bacterium]